MADDSDRIKAEATLDDIIVSLQKSFSRVSRDSNAWKEKDSKAALAYVSGPVRFNLTLRVNPDGDDRLVYNRDGGLEVSLEGTINTDVRLKPAAEGKLGG